MIDATSLSIEIINTRENDMPLAVEFTERAAPKLSYNGGDERHQYMMPSELTFSMEVSYATDLYFKHLFTGDESNYQVILKDQDSNVLWRGYLLPEQYEEPYEHAILYVGFTATDGLGRLKNKTLGGQFYDRRHSVITFLRGCLQQTNLNLPILFAPAIQNDSPQVGADWNRILIDGNVYKSDSDKLDNTYKILESLLELLGCSLYCINDEWIVTGHNRYRNDGFDIKDIEYYHYDITGSLVGLETRDVNPNKIHFEGKPQVTLLPPVQRVTATYEINEESDVLPEDLIQQPYTRFSQFAPIPPVTHWVRSSNQISLGRSQFGPQRLPDSYYQSGGFTSTISDDERERRENIVSSTEFISLITNSDFHPTNNAGLYMELEVPKYLSSAPDYIDVDLEIAALFKYINGGGPFPEINKDNYGNQNMHYEILCDGVTIISNRPDYQNREGYLLDISWEGTTLANFAEDPLIMVGKLSLKDMKLPEPGGLLQLRIYVVSSAGNNIEANRVGLRNASISYTADDERVTDVTRAIDWTTGIDLDLAHGGNVGDMANTHFTLSGQDNNSANYEEYAVVGNTFFSEGFVPPVTVIEASSVSSIDYQILKNAVESGKELYGIRYNSATYQKIKTDYPSNFQMFRNGNGVYLEYVDGGGFFYASETIKDRLFVYIPAPQSDVPREFRELWSRYNAPLLPENRDYRACRAQLVHDSLPAPLVKIDPILFGLHDPFSVKQYDIDGDKNFIATSITMNLDDGTTDATLVELRFDDEVETSFNT